MKTKVLYKPGNEFLALSIKSLLENEGICSIVHSFQIPAYDGIAQMMRPQWGEILVAEEDYTKAKELLDSFLAGEGTSIVEDETTQSDKDVGPNTITNNQTEDKND